jgi:hypothetical protein
MKMTPPVIGGIVVVVLLLIVGFRVWVKGGILPPHEFAYGTTLNKPEQIPERMDQFLSLDEMDPEKVRIETYVGNSSEKNLKPLIRYFSSQTKNDLGPLISGLQNADQLANQKEKAVALIKTLLPYRDRIRNEAQQDTIIVFVYYGLKQPSNLSPATKAQVSNLVREYDTGKQAAEFNSGECPTNFLVGNINIYPLGLENTSWHNTVELASPKDAPILEVRFMGLRGIFRYLLDEMTRKTGASFVHLDGESL